MRHSSLVFLGTLLTAIGCAPDLGDDSQALAPGGALTTGPEAAFAPAPGGFQALNRAWRFDTRVAEDGAHFRDGRDDLALRFSGWGRERVQPVKDVAPVLAGDRVVRALEGATEWWLNTPSGAEQGWDLAARPDGDGELTIELQVQGGTPVLGLASVQILGDHGGQWSYGGLRAVDDAGRVLPSRFDVRGDTIGVKVDDAGAEWPIHVDPVMTTAVATWNGSGTETLGSAVTTGDFNNDGKSDIAVGAAYHGSGVGEVYVYYGTATVPSSTPDVTLTVPSGAGLFGYALHAADVNGDGLDDLLVGSPYATTAAMQDGAVWIFYGAAYGLPVTTSTKVTGTGAANNYFGCSVSSGDINGDGYDDVIIGEYGYSSENGRAWIYAGSSSGISTSTYRTITGPTASSRYGWAVSAGGSASSDAYSELVIGAPAYSSNKGRAYLFTGSASFFTTTPAVTTVYTGTDGYQFGYALTLERDFNGDAYEDMVIGAPTGTASTFGRVYYYQSSGTAMATGKTSSFDGPSAYSYFGASLAAIPDTDDDGYNELLVGGWTVALPGTATLYDGSSVGLATSGRSTTFAGTGTDALGMAVGGGDVNGDGNGDILFGSPGANTYAGKLVLEYGGADVDNDGWVVNGSGYQEDCADSDATVSPSATEICDTFNTDEDCDGLADNADSSATGLTTFYRDADGDGYGDLATTTLSCDAPSGYVVDSTDCDDASASAHPGGAEVCDAANVDEDCDGLSDDADSSVSGATLSTWYADSDADAYGGASLGDSCDAPSGAVATSTDCDDGDAAIHPGATEVCDAANQDEDCDGLADNDDASASSATKTQFYVDADGDSYGSTTSNAYCDAPSGYAATSTDCDDGDASTNPAATEVCDGADNDCNSVVDDGVSDTFYKDADGDGYGDPAVTASGCSAPTGYVSVGTDCDDAESSVHPGAVEVCDATNTDDDCNGLANDSDPAVTNTTAYYADADGDGYGSTASVAACAQPSGYGATSGDCDDTDNGVNPGATDLPGDGTDGDCDGSEVCYVDADDDGFRPDTGATVTSSDGDCSDSGEALAIDPTGDCDDANPGVNPGAADAAGDGLDANCDGADSCYVDADGDGARTAFLVASADTDCLDAGEAPATADVDCDDTDASVFPAAGEITGSGVDEDCDGSELCFVDDDDDGYRPDDTSTVVSVDGDCGDAGEALASDLTGDCDDANAAFNPGAIEADCTDLNDYNCDGSVTSADADADGWAACEDCNDADSSVSPDGVELAGDGVDSDCDGVDTCYDDADADGYRVDTTFTGGTVACNDVGEASASVPNGDCDDADATVNPGAVEGIGDGLDADCDGAEVCYVDADGDTWRVDSTVVSADLDCADVGEALAVAGPDCDDSDASVNPAGTELADDGVDSDCDGGELCYVDADLDGFRTDATVISADADCNDAGEATSDTPSGDCDDGDATVNPYGVELPGDGVDQDCDGTEVCYADADGDAYRPDDGATVDSADLDCDDAGEAYSSALAGDCDDADAAFNPAADESDCTDPNDYNCDGSVGYADADADGFGACEECNDSDALVNPDAVELPGDGVDQDCDGAEQCYVDADDDGWRPDDSVTTSANIACDGAGEATATDLGVDCDDADAAVNPGATEIAADGVDQDCDGTEYCYADSDADGYRADDGVIGSSDTDCDDAGEALSTTPDGDCDDTSAAYNPTAPETDCLDPADYNCDGSSGYSDADADGFAACEECDDGSSAVNPDATEVCNDVDDDCDGTVDGPLSADASTWYADADGDGFTDPGESVVECDAPEGYASASGDDDCDDADEGVNPDAVEIAGDGIDQDCDGSDGAVGDDTGTGDDTGDGDTGEPTDKGGCGCASAPSTDAAWAFGIVALALSRRRRA